MEKPIIFNTEMVTAILEGRKTQTRRIIKNKYSNADITFFENKYGKRLVYQQNDAPGPVKNPDGTTKYTLMAVEEVKKPYEVGDILYVRETWQEWTGGYAYKVGGDYPQSNIGKWKPSIHMPKDAARIFLKITDVRAERLQDISEEDAKLEGATKATFDFYFGKFSHGADTDNYKDGFHELWNMCYAWPKSWPNNPWVWVVEFEVNL